MEASDLEKALDEGFPLYGDNWTTEESRYYRLILEAARAHLQSLQSDPGEDLAVAEKAIPRSVARIRELYEEHRGAMPLAFVQDFPAAMARLEETVGTRKTWEDQSDPADDLAVLSDDLKELFWRYHDDNGVNWDELILPTLRSALSRLRARLALRETAALPKAALDWLASVTDGEVVFLKDQVLLRWSVEWETHEGAFFGKSVKTASGPTILVALEKAGVKTEGS